MNSSSYSQVELLSLVVIPLLSFAVLIILLAYYYPVVTNAISTRRLLIALPYILVSLAILILTALFST